MKFLGTNITRNIERDLFDYVPKEYEDYRESRAILRAESVEFERLNLKISDVLDQFFVDTATWGLAEWERICGLPVALDYTIYDAFRQNNVSFSTVEGVAWDELETLFIPSASDRRSAIKSKLRGAGTITREKVADVCSAYSGGSVIVREYPSEYRVVIEFTDITGVPSNMDTLQEVLRDLMPAHILVEYQYRYLRWNEFDSELYTWDSLGARNFTWNELEEAVN
ncbi:putative phage tail protein [Cytobacillus gottheilii]|uniref:YmfQ family protein n=1 Tax=Cytobacillus gottheilii TaxID=859144 RepID=A0ABX8FG37_9BACI|nr:putative phage tail protein [Cytobacillus gottheilii]QVY62996.1 YmfQ family protein [Cytobacillus gottheilii]